MNTKLYIPIVILSIKDNVNLTKKLSNGLKKSFYWKSYQIIPAKVIEKEKNIYELLSAPFHDVKSLLALAYSIAVGAANNEANIKKQRKIFSSNRSD